jgi:catechol 2,3-dioxygenase-like lactoylglutathione lyase family enzyme
MTLHFRYSGLIVSDVPQTVDFYQKAFGCRLRYMHPSSGYAELETGSTLLAFIGEAFIEASSLLGGLRYAPSRPASEPAAQIVAFVTDNLDADWERATSAGAAVVKLPEPKPWGQTTGYLRDCNGIIVELCTRSPRDVG